MTDTAVAYPEYTDGTNVLPQSPVPRPLLSFPGQRSTNYAQQLGKRADSAAQETCILKNATNRATKFTRRTKLRRPPLPTTTRKEFLLQVAGITAAPLTLAAQPSAASPKVLTVVAHPDDEYAFAATVYRITNELGGSVDQLVLTNGEGGFRYSRLAEAYYGLPLTREDIGRSRLPAIRKDETLRAGRILGIRHHWFLHQKDARFTLDGDEAFKGIWDVNASR